MVVGIDCDTYAVWMQLNSCHSCFVVLLGSKGLGLTVRRNSLIKICILIDQSFKKT